MQMEIISPQEGGFLTEIKWNNKELLREIKEKTAEYTGVIYSDEGWIKTAKSDRSKLNKLRTSIETERKRIKAQVLAPYEEFEKQVKEVIAPIDEAIASIDKQLKAADEKARTEKMAEIRDAFIEEGFQNFVELEMIFNDKWLNKTYSMAQIKQEMESKKYEIGTAVLTIHNLHEYSFEAMDYYKKTLDLAASLSEAQRLVDLQRRKEEAQKAEEERRRKAEEARFALAEEARRAAEEQRKQLEAQKAQEQQVVPPEPPAPAPEEKIYQIDFRVWGTKAQITALRQYLVDNGLKYGKVGN